MQSVTCDSCKTPAAATAGLLCAACGAVLPPRRLDPFAALGVPRRFDLDDAELESRYRDLQRRLHPDRFARAEARQRMLSLQAATTLNDAYRVLKKPIPRAEALLALDGLAIGENERADDELLMEIMELREQLDDARAAGDAAAVARMAASTRARRAAALAEIAALFAGQGDRQAIKARLILIRYLDRLIEAASGGDTDTTEAGAA